MANTNCQPIQLPSEIYRTTLDNWATIEGFYEGTAQPARSASPSADYFPRAQAIIRSLAATRRGFIISQAIQEKTFYTETVAVFPERGNVIDCISDISDNQTFTLSGFDLKRLIIKAYMGDSVGLSMAFVPAEHNINVDKIPSVEAPPNMDKNNMPKKSASQSLLETIKKQSWKIGRAKQLRAKELQPPVVDDDLAKYVFDYDEEDKVR